MTDQPQWAPAQLARLRPSGVARCVDVHCHCLPGLDDGPATLDESLALCQLLVDDGITTVIATPHQLGIYDGMTTAAMIRQAVVDLAKELSAAGIPLEVAPGADVRIDERLVQHLDADRILTPADVRRHLLIELPHAILVDPLPSIVALRNRGVQAIMTHPERHRYLQHAADRIEAWVDAGAVLQITAGSLLGDFGERAHREAWRLVHAGLVSLVATDAHDEHRRPPRLTAAMTALEQEVGLEAAQVMCLENPLRVFQGEPIPSCRAD